jgi:hypothetical protein
MDLIMWFLHPKMLLIKDNLAKVGRPIINVVFVTKMKQHNIHSYIFIFLNGMAHYSLDF